MNDAADSSATGRFSDDVAALAALLDAGGIDSGSAIRIAPRAAGSIVPMSFAQELLWLLDRATPGMTAYNLPSARRIRGPLELASLERALAAVAARHELLRARFSDAAGVHQLLIDAPGPVAVRVLDLTSSAAGAREAEARRIVGERARTPFDLADEHMFRATVIRLAPDDNVLVLESHHIVMDGWAFGLVMRDLAQAYVAVENGRTPDLTPPAVQFGDFARWQRDHLQGDRLVELLAFWRTQLGDAEPLALPTDHPRAGTPTFEGARQSRTLSPEQLATIKQCAHEHGATLYMMLLAAYGVVLHRYAGRDRVLIGSGSAGRTLPDTEGIVGYLNNTLVQSVDCSGDPTVAELLARVRASALGAYDHQEVPLEKLILELRQGQDRLSTAPLFDVVLTMQDVGAADVVFPDLDVTPFGFDAGATKFDITLLPSETPNGLRLTVQYRADLFEATTMQRFLGHVENALAGMAAQPAARVSALPLLTPDERTELAAFNATTIDEGPGATAVDLFESHVARDPTRNALVCVPTGGGDLVTLTFGAVNGRANQLAHRLRALGVGPDTPVGLRLDRSIDAIVGMLGILKAGGAYVPLSLDAPPARLAQQLAECGATVVVTGGAPLADLPASITTVSLDGEAEALRALPDSNPVAAAAPDNLAYILYTSGSTGAPKGVAVTHRNIVHYARAISRVLGEVPASQPGDGFAAIDGWQFALASTLAADLGGTSLYPSLFGGGTLHVLSTDVTNEPARFAEYFATHPIDVLKITPNHLAALVGVRADDELASVMPRACLVLGGEALRHEFATRLLAAPCRVLNHYGPTETTVGATTFSVTRQALSRAVASGAMTVPIGLPLANMRAYVVDRYGQEQPIGMPGELWLGGLGVATGYFQRPDLTTERFIRYQGERVYRTGDRVRRLPDGSIEFLGRIDHQVKVRGYRVELGEIEQVLLQHPGVAQAICVLRAPSADEPALVAYAVPKSGGYAVSHSDRPTPERLLAWIGARLPAYMVPATVVMLDQLPLTANGKVNRGALPDPIGTPTASGGFVEPATETERQLAAIWADVLKKDRVGSRDHFLELGGHSLMAIRVLGKISRAFGVRLPLRTLFDSPTVEQLAVVVERERGGGSLAPTIGANARDAHRVRTGDGKAP